MSFYSECMYLPSTHTYTTGPCTAHSEYMKKKKKKIKLESTQYEGSTIFFMFCFENKKCGSVSEYNIIYLDKTLCIWYMCRNTTAKYEHIINKHIGYWQPWFLGEYILWEQYAFGWFNWILLQLATEPVDKIIYIRFTNVDDFLKHLKQ